MYNTILNDKQYSALLETEKPLLILAGAGSGKTRVITYKIAYLVKEMGYLPYGILAVTFTNKAAKEMRERLYKILEMDEDAPLYRSLWITTFHSACARILRKDIDKLGYGTNFTIYDSLDTKKLIKEIITNYNILTKDNINSITSYISNCKNRFEDPEFVINTGKSKQNDFIYTVGKIYRHYEEALKQNNALDFDDLIVKTIVLFAENKDVLLSYKKLFKYLLVDEFQDTNHIQYSLIKLLHSGTNISVVGDDDQSIYSWRGADIENILNFKNDFRNCSVVKLEQNYRSTKHILNASYSLVKNNKGRFDKKLWSEKELGNKLSFWRVLEDREEGLKVIRTIQELINTNDVLPKDIAILYRMNYQSRIIEEYLKKVRIPYKIFGSVKFYDRMEIKDIISYLIIIVNENDSLSLKRVINVPKRKIGLTSLKKIEAVQIEYSLSFNEAFLYCGKNNILKGQVKAKIDSFLEWLSSIREQRHNMSVTALMDKIIDDVDYLNYLKTNFDNYDERLENINEFKRAILEYEEAEEEPSLEHFIMEMALRTDTDLSEEDNNYISLMTVHTAKGLEFDNVFIIGMCDGIFPHYRAFDDRKQLEEERRLFYVGITRAKKECFLFSASKQFIRGITNYYKISRFIFEIDEEYIDKYGELDDELIKSKELGTPKNHAIIKERKLSKNNDIKNTRKDNRNDNRKHIENIKDILVGETLLHNYFGKGVVIKINEKAELSTILINFSGKKRLLILKYSTLYKDST